MKLAVVVPKSAPETETVSPVPAAGLLDFVTPYKLPARTCAALASRSTTTGITPSWNRRKLTGLHRRAIMLFVSLSCTIPLVGVGWPRPDGMVRAPRPGQLEGRLARR